MNHRCLAAGSVLDASSEEVVRAAASAGFDGVGLRVSDHHALDATARRGLRRTAADLGVAVHDVEVHRIGSGADIGPLLEAAVDLGAPYVLVVSDVGDLGATRDSLGDAVARADEVGLRVGLEYMAWTTPSAPATAVELATATGAWVVTDLLHHHRVGAGVTELSAIVASGRLGWVQLADAPGAAPDDLVREARHGRLAPGEGGLPLRELLGVVPDDVTISVEVQSDDLTARFAPTERARHLVDAARRVLGDPT